MQPSAGVRKSVLPSLLMSSYHEQILLEIAQGQIHAHAKQDGMLQQDVTMQFATQNVILLMDIAEVPGYVHAIPVGQLPPPAILVRIKYLIKNIKK